MGDHFQTLVDLDATEAEARAFAAKGLAWLVAEGIVQAERTDCVLGAPLGHPPGPRWTTALRDEVRGPGDGLNVKTSRTVFDCGQGGAKFAVCPHCTGQVDLHTQKWEEVEGAWKPFGAAIETWHGRGQATVTCPLCRQVGDLRAWTWEDDYFAFGYLGFEFWNWPEFSPVFVDRFARALGARRIRLMAGKL